MIYAVMPVGSYHGWGVCGKYISAELSLLTDFTLITKHSDITLSGDNLETNFLKTLLIPQQEYDAIMAGTLTKLSGALLQAITGASLMPTIETLKGDLNVGYTFFEDNLIAISNVSNAKDFYDFIVTGSSWCEQVLRNAGITNTTTIIQGIDPTIFNPSGNDKRYFKDKFVIFSGGKFELRKGQDVVIKAFKAMQERYKDVMLVCSWYNGWTQSAMTMTASPYITLKGNPSDFTNFIIETITHSGIDISSVVCLPPYPNAMMAKIYKNTDIGLFPNRCEGGTNLVLMEYMACGKPVIATYSSGHKDILTDSNCIKLNNLKNITLQAHAPNQAKPIDIATWDEPDLDEVIDKLFWAYEHREQLKIIANEAGSDLARLTWQVAARRFYDILINR